MIKTTKNMFEVLSVLFSGKDLSFHDLAKEVKLSVMGVSKIIKKLEKEKIVNMTKIGRSSIVKLNKTKENIELLSLTEKYKFEKFINKYPGLKGFLMQLKERTRTKVDFLLIFGSYASDEVSSDSDLDLLVASSNKDIYKILDELSVLINVNISPIFIIKKDFIKGLKKEHRLYKEIANGKRTLINGEYNFLKLIFTY